MILESAAICSRIVLPGGGDGGKIGHYCARGEVTRLRGTNLIRTKVAAL
jgi:hypothetical protein